MDNDLVLWIVVATALAFDFTNGFHDTANAVAASISTRALSPRLAVGLAAVLLVARADRRRRRVGVRGGGPGGGAGRRPGHEGHRARPRGAGAGLRRRRGR